jgi:threonine efflux protein
MAFWHGFLVLTLIHLLAAASPGPDFVLVTRESIRAGRRAGLLTSLGIGLGLAVHIAYSAAGVAALVVRSELLLHLVKALGGCFLLYLGVVSLRTRASDSPTQDIHEVRVHRSSFVAKGFLCNLLNPKAPLYFLALFTAVIPINTPTSTLWIYGTWLVFLQWLWFGAVATLFSHARIRAFLHNSRVWVDRVFGVSMIALALRLLWSALME